MVMIIVVSSTSFYTDQFEGSFSQGVPFQENPTTGDCRVCGSLASLAGLEKAIETDNSKEIEFALKRIRLLNSINLSIGGIPLIYQGDELGILNDHAYLEDEFKRDDTRWVNRPAITADAIKLAEQSGSYQNRISQDLKQMVALRKQNQVFGEAKTEILETYRPHLFAYCRSHENGEKLLAICNFGEVEQQLPVSICDVLGSRDCIDILSGQRISEPTIVVPAYEVLWLVKSAKSS